MRILKTGDPCPCCGQPILLTDPDALRMLAAIADLAGFSDPKKKSRIYTPRPRRERHTGGAGSKE